MTRPSLLETPVTANLECGGNRTDLGSFVDVMKTLENGATGPTPLDTFSYVNAERLSSTLHMMHPEWKASQSVALGIATTLDKMAYRKNLVPEPHIDIDIANKIERIIDLAGEPVSKTETLALEKMTLNLKDDEISYYLGDQFIADCAMIADGSKITEAEIERFFSIRQRMTIFARDRKAIDSSHSAVEKATLIASNPLGYIFDKTNKPVNSAFVNSLSAYNLLTLTTTSPLNTDAALVFARDLFDEVSDKFPLVAEEMPVEITTKLFRTGSGLHKGEIDREKLFNYFSRKEAALQAGAGRFIARKISGNSDQHVKRKVADILLYARHTRSTATTEAAKMAGVRPFAVGEFGNDLSAKMLDLVSRTGNNETTQLALQRTADIIDSVSTFTTEGPVGDVDPRAAQSIREAILTRTSEIVYALDKRAQNGLSGSEPLAALEKLAEWSAGTSEMLNCGIPIKVQEAGDTKLYHFLEPESGRKYPGALELTTHGKSSTDASAREVYIKEGRGARMSISFDEEYPERALSLKGAIRRGAMNGRLDKSVYNAITRSSNPNAQTAEVSFDIASHHGAGASKHVTDMISESRPIREGDDKDLNGIRYGAYTYDIIDQSYGNREVFAKLIRNMSVALDVRHESYEQTRRHKQLGHRALTVK